MESKESKELAFKYKYAIDKEVLKDFFLQSNDNFNKKHLKALKQVFLAVFVTHYSKFFNIKEDLWEDAFRAILERKSQYDPKYSAYNYVYTVFRNEVGNKIKNYSREVSTEEVTIPKEEYHDKSVFIPECIDRFRDQLLGAVPYDFIRIPREYAVPMICFMKSKEHFKVKTPGFIRENPDSVDLLYKIINELLYE